MPQALSLRLLVTALIAVVAVIATAGPLRSQLAGQGVERGRSLVAPGPFAQSRALEPLAPTLPDGGPNGAAIWVHGDSLAGRRGRAVPRRRHSGARRADVSPRRAATRSS